MDDYNKGETLSFSLFIHPSHRKQFSQHPGINKHAATRPLFVFLPMPSGNGTKVKQKLHLKGELLTCWEKLSQEIGKFFNSVESSMNHSFGSTTCV